MSAAQAKVVLDKLLKIYEPLKDAQTLLSELEIAERSLTETRAQLKHGADEIVAQQAELSNLEQAAEFAKLSRDETLKEADNEAREIVAIARNEAQDVLMQMEAAKATLQKDVDSLRTAVVMLEKDVAAKRDELASVTQAIREYKSNLEKAVTAL